MRIFLAQRMLRQKRIEVIGAKNVAINANTNSLNTKESNTNAAFLNVRMKKLPSLTNIMAVKAFVNISKQEISKKEQEKQKIDYGRMARP